MRDGQVHPRRRRCVLHTGSMATVYAPTDEGQPGHVILAQLERLDTEEGTGQTRIYLEGASHLSLALDDARRLAGVLLRLVDQAEPRRRPGVARSNPQHAAGLPAARSPSPGAGRFVADVFYREAWTATRWT